MTPPRYDAIIVGSGVSGSAMAQELCAAGLKVALLEAGKHFTRHTYPREEVDGSSQLYWSGGVELTHQSDIGLLRPKAVGGGTIVNQALADRFDESALGEWTRLSGVDQLSVGALTPWYERAESQLNLQKIPRQYWNRNAEIFAEGFAKNGYRCAPLRRAQKDCHFEAGNDCIECLQGCPIDSKQSTPVTTLARALAAGLDLHAECEAYLVKSDRDGVEVRAVGTDGEIRFFGRRLILAAGAIGNTKLLFQSGFGERMPALGKNFFTHPQDMVLGLYDEPVDAFRGPFQALKSDDENFRAQGFKLENVFAPPVGLAMLLPGVGRNHQALMKKLRYLACVEVAVRDTSPGTIHVSPDGRVRIEKSWNAEDRRRQTAGLNAITRILRSTGARRLLRGRVTIGLHLMGGCAIGEDSQAAIVGPNFHLHGHRHIYCADSSVFPSAPGLNPSLTILALSLQGAQTVLQEASR